MAVFPTESQFLHNDDFAGYNLTTTEDVVLDMVSCIQVRPKGTVEDHSETAPQLIIAAKVDICFVSIFRHTNMTT